MTFETADIPDIADEDLRNNWNRLLDVAGLTAEERREAMESFVAKVGKVPGTEA